MQKIQLTTADHISLGATFFPSDGAQRIVLIAGATAVPQGFYRRFAQAMNQAGFHALSFDYRGIAESKSQPLAQTHAGFQDWGQRDTAAALDFCAQHGDIYLAGHSFGGHALGMLPQPERIKATWICGSGAGYSGYMPALERVKVELLWKVLAPISTAIKGYAPMSWFGIGEDLPKGVYQNWKHWCSFPHYFFDDPKLQGSDFLRGFAEFSQPSKFVNASDDLWAPAKSRDAFLRGFLALTPEKSEIAPHQFEVKGIGHMGYFRSQMQPLWKDAVEFFNRFQ